jgi:hypothetical protein
MIANTMLFAIGKRKMGGISLDNWKSAAKGECARRKTALPAKLHMKS